MFYDVSTSKDDKGYWQWDSFTTASPVAATEAPKSFPAPKSNYETPAERAQKQVFIIKQSSITAALKFMELNKEKPSVENVLSLAQELTDWVLTTQEAKQDKLFDLPNDLEVE